MVGLILILLLIVVLVIVLVLSNRCPVEGMASVDGDIDYLDNMPIYVINLKSRPDRKTKAEKELAKYKINGTFVHAVNGSKLDIQQLMDEGLYAENDTDKPLKKGEIGCYFSHLKCWYHILNSGRPYGMVLEDDVIFCNDFRNKFNDVMDQIVHYKWDYFCLGRRCKPRWFNFRNCSAGTAPPDSSSKEVFYPNIVGYATYAYIIKRETILKLLETVFPIMKPVDVVILEERDQQRITVMAMKRDLVTVRDLNDSDTVAIR